MKATVKAKRKGLLASMRDMPDHNLSVSHGPFQPVAHGRQGACEGACAGRVLTTSVAW